MDRETIVSRLNRAYFSEERHERALLDRLPQLLEGVGLFVDIGASLGQYTYFANRALSRARIIAIEADPVRVEELRRNCAKWSATSSNSIRVIHGAITDESGTVDFFSSGSDVSGGIFAHATAGEAPSWQRLRVPAVRLDELDLEQTRTLIKIDVEGAEMRVLRGAGSLLQRGDVDWLVELHSWIDPRDGSGAEGVFEIFRRADYQAAHLHGHDLFSKGALPFRGRIVGAARRLARRSRALLHA
jgi:FkbM family methyltransferase